MPCSLSKSRPIIMSYFRLFLVIWNVHVISFLSQNSFSLNLAFTVLDVDICPAAVSHTVLESVFVLSLVTRSDLMILLLAPVSNKIFIFLYFGFPNR